MGKKTVITVGDGPMMQVRTSDYGTMRMLDGYAGQMEGWKLTEVGRAGGELVSKTYTAPLGDLALLARELSAGRAGQTAVGGAVNSCMQEFERDCPEFCLA